MAKSYHIEVARHVTEVDAKWIDNLLSHFDVAGVAGGKQGTPRRITLTGIAHIVLIQRLSSRMGVRIGEAVGLASRLMSPDSTISIHVGIDLSIDRDRFLDEVRRLVEQAAEAIVPARRGRPPVGLRVR